MDNGFITIDEVLEHTDEDDIENYDNMDDDEKINAKLSYGDSLNEQDLKLYIESFNADAYYQKIRGNYCLIFNEVIIMSENDNKEMSDFWAFFGFTEQDVRNLNHDTDKLKQDMNSLFTWKEKR